MIREVPSMSDMNPDAPVCRDPDLRSNHQDVCSPSRAVPPAPLPDRVPPAACSRWERWLLRQTLAAVGSPPVAISLEGGERLVDPEPRTAPVARVVIRDRGTLWRLMFDPIFQFGEAYATGRLRVEGDLLELLLLLDRSLSKAPRLGWFGRALSKWVHGPRRNTLAGSRDNIHHHYDIGNDFYRLWLDARLLYTCAYFPAPTVTLEQAQDAKMDLVCRKLRLRRGETVVEAGCGWGALALHMARHYGVTVRAFNISREQISAARTQAKSEGLEQRVEFVEDDWRNINGRCDAFVSVGMLEHVGLENYRLLGDVIHRCLHPRGRGLIHSIGQNLPKPFDPWAERRIFPGAYPPTLAQMTRIFEAHNFSVLDVENLRLHYALTLRHWLARYERSVETVRAMFDEQFVRMWRLYLTASVAAFETGGLQLFQVVFAPGLNNEIPWTRDYLLEMERAAEGTDVIER
jgi:cyclopropane-fatty-acyl-phospholipid synthase